MIHYKTQIWTKHGWKNYEDVTVNDTLISYNERLGYCEYDKVNKVWSDYLDTNYMGIKFKSMNLFVTNDHPIITTNRITKEVSRFQIRDVLAHNFAGKRGILYSKPFLPYKRTQDFDDLKWSARIAATYAQSKYYVNLDHVWELIEEITAHEARVWLDEFFHWNVKGHASPNWMFCTCLSNKGVRDMIFHVGPRAGVGVFWAPLHNFNLRKGGMWAIRTSSLRDAGPSLRNGWHQDRFQGVAFNLKTNNGNFLARRHGGSFLVACDK